MTESHEAKVLLEAAQRLKAARSAHVVEERRLATSRDQVAELDAAIAEIDPDTAEFDRAVTRRDRARARQEALAIRVLSTRKASELAQKDAEEAELANTRAEVRQANAEIAALQGTLDAAVRALTKQIEIGCRELLPLVYKRNALEEKLPLENGVYYHIHSRPYWLLDQINLDTVKRAIFGVSHS